MIRFFFTFSWRFQCDYLRKEFHSQISRDSSETNNRTMKVNKCLLVPQNVWQTNKVTEELFYGDQLSLPFEVLNQLWPHLNHLAACILLHVNRNSYFETSWPHSITSFSLRDHKVRNNSCVETNHHPVQQPDNDGVDSLASPLEHCAALGKKICWWPLFINCLSIPMFSKSSLLFVFCFFVRF